MGCLILKLRILKEIVCELLYPPRCPICDSVLQFRAEKCCSVCSKSLPRVTGSVCMKCGKPVWDETREYCEDCRKQVHSFDAGRAAFTYSGGVRRAVYRMKSENRRDYVDFFAEAVAGALKPHLKYWKPDVILSVPMHPSRKRKRGYNQSELLAQRISVLTGIPAEFGLVRCIRKTGAQKNLGRRDRMQNLRGSFQMCKRLTEGMNVLIVDDVYTTGSTVDEMSRILKQNGASHVYFGVICTGKGKKAVCTKENVCYTTKDKGI